MLQVRARLKEDIKKVRFAEDCLPLCKSSTCMPRCGDCSRGGMSSKHACGKISTHVCTDVLMLQAQDLVERLTDPEKGKDQPHPVRPAAWMRHRLPISCAHGSSIALVHLCRNVLQDMPASEIIRASGLAFLWWQKVR